MKTNSTSHDLCFWIYCGHDLIWWCFVENTENEDSHNLFSNLVYLCYLWFRIDEKDEKWNLSRVAVDSLGSAMLVTIILDLWRIFLGPIVPIPESSQCGQPGLAWFQVQTKNTWFSEAANYVFPHHHLAFINTDKIASPAPWRWWHDTPLKEWGHDVCVTMERLLCHEDVLCIVLYVMHHVHNMIVVLRWILLGLF